jgi:hypothetical protein
MCGVIGHHSNRNQLIKKSSQVHPIDCHSLLFEWIGSDTSLRPALFAAHLDVVPIEPGQLKQMLVMSTKEK